MSPFKKLPRSMLPGEVCCETQTRESYHVLRIISEFVEAGEELRAAQPAVGICGSARMSENHPDYEFTLRLARKLSDTGFLVIPGGGPGIMEVANKDAFVGVGPAVGLNIVLPHEQKANSYQDLSIKFQHLFPRKVMFVKHAMAYVVMPGGFGMSDELFEGLTLAQTDKAPNRLIILVGKDFWSRLSGQIREELLGRDLIAATDMDLIRLIDDEDGIIEEIFTHYENRLGTLGGLGADTWSLGLQAVYCRYRFMPEGAGRLRRVSDSLWFRCVRNIGETAIKR